MLELVTYCTLFIFLLMIFIQDIISRKIFIFLPVLVFFNLLLISQFYSMVRWNDILLNTGFVIANLLGLLIYFTIKFRKFYNPFDKDLGWGDILLFVAIIPICTFHYFMIFFITGLIFSVILHQAVLLLKPIQRTVPLAGYLSLFSMVYLITTDLMSFNFFKFFVPVE